MSSIIASSEPARRPRRRPRTGRGVLSSCSMPIDCASRRAGSMVSTTTLRPRSAARSASAADVVVLPTPPAPQHTMISVVGVVEQRVDVEVGCVRWGAHAIPCFRSSSASSTSAPLVDPAREAGQLVGGHALGRDELALLVLELTSYGVVARLGDRATRPGRRRRRPGRGSARRSTAVGSTVPSRTCASALGLRSCGRTRLTMTPPTGRPAARSSPMPSDGLLDGHLLQDRDEVHGRARRAQQLHHLVGLGLDRSHLREAGQLGVDAEELADAARWAARRAPRRRT